MSKILPYSDNEMLYDKTKHRYILTVDYVRNVLGVDLNAEFNTNNTTASVIVLNSFLDNASSEIYNYLYMHNHAKTIQYIIAKSESARAIVKEAISKQVLYSIYNGDLGFSSKKEEQDMSLNKYAKEILDSQEVRETGTTLTYVGVYSFCPPNYEVGDY